MTRAIFWKPVAILARPPRPLKLQACVCPARFWTAVVLYQFCFEWPLWMEGGTASRNSMGLLEKREGACAVQNLSDLWSPTFMPKCLDHLLQSSLVTRCDELLVWLNGAKNIEQLGICARIERRSGPHFNGVGRSAA